MSYFNQELVKGVVMYISMMILVVGGMWYGGTFFAASIKDIEVVEVEPGVKCAIVSRMFNTSVDCWSNDNDG